LIQNAPEKNPIIHTHSPLAHHHSHQSSSASLRRNNSSILVITAPLNNANLEQCNQQHLQYQQCQQSQIIANIENSSINYELDEDDGYSQISFKQHLRLDEGNSSRGSMHNAYDNTSISTTNTSATTRNLTTADADSNFLKMIPGLQEVREAEDDEKRQKIQTSMFHENSDILNDQNYPKLYFRHSTFLLPTTAKNSRSVDDALSDMTGEKYKEKRRYSDTKLLNSLHFENEFLVKNSEDVLRSPTKKENSENFVDQLEVNIQNILDIDVDEVKIKAGENLSENQRKQLFQSLPNLEVSSKDN
jgi:hypothetical protein